MGSNRVSSAAEIVEWTLVCSTFLLLYGVAHDLEATFSFEKPNKKTGKKASSNSAKSKNCSQNQSLPFKPEEEAKEAKRAKEVSFLPLLLPRSKLRCANLQAVSAILTALPQTDSAIGIDDFHVFGFDV